MKIAVVFTVRARRQLQTALHWWKRNRDKAPNALRDDMDDALDLLVATPDIGVTVQRRPRRVRRYHLERTSYDIYYYLMPGLLTVTNVWHSSRRPPTRL